MFLAFVLGLYLATGALPSLVSACPSQCSCFFHNLSDGSMARSVICNDPEISIVPASFPVDTSKLRIEKTAIHRIPSEAFSYLPNLEFLWMSFNVLSSLKPDSFRGMINLEELRLDGNALTAFPWESLMDMSSLTLLDLHNNQLTSVPADATIYLKNLTYLDLSSNNLLTVPAEVLLTLNHPGLHDNPWVCDCRLYDLVQFQKSPTLSVALIDTRLRCAAPESLSGVLFSDAELRRCQAPHVHTAVAHVRSAVGNNVLLRCGTIGVPSPDLAWRRAEGKALNGTVQLENSKEGIIWSILSVPAVSYHDSGKYVCKATNYAGNAETIISLVISDAPPKPDNNNNQTSVVAATVKKNKVNKPSGMGKAAYQDKLVDRLVVPTPNRATPGPAKLPSPDGLLELEKTNLSNLAQAQYDPDRIVRSVKVLGDTENTITLNWRAPKAKNTTAFSVLYAVFGERDMRKINVAAGQNRVFIEGLVPKTKYIACVCVRGLIPKKEQCVIFSTDEAASAAGTQKLINVIVITVACVIAVPLTVIVCCGALKRRIQKMWGKKSKDIQDSYVTFETLSPGTKAKGLEGEYLTRLNPEESNRLLSARSSLDSEATAKIEGQPNEYFC
uniref:Leucine-rich repeat, immunoglobulin-like and transmembrane domains 1a n=1 Tax=Hucho hucho TaxID=62062 RepID=A0A4W5LQR5_9TELE